MLPYKIYSVNGIYFRELQACVASTSLPNMAGMAAWFAAFDMRYSTKGARQKLAGRAESVGLMREGTNYEPYNGGDWVFMLIKDGGVR